MASRGSKAPFSFHCVICYEFLNPIDRPPVVLPCGHTFLCEQCAKRLDKCMECRVPLTILAPRTLQPTHSNVPVAHDDFDFDAIRAARMQRRHATNTQRSSGLPGGTTRPFQNAPAQDAPPARISLQSPKNIVLISLIESIQKMSASKTLNSDGYESGDDDELVQESLRIVGSSSGTYVVRAKEGLIVYDKKHNKNVRTDIFLDISNKRKEIRRLVHGQTVQISTLEDSVASVARGVGFINVERSSDLVRGKLPGGKESSI
jgi:hypothetical protein